MSTNPLNKREFFWNHMKKDLKISCSSLSISKDEMLVLIHMICKDILKSPYCNYSRYFLFNLFLILNFYVSKLANLKAGTLKKTDKYGKAHSMRLI